MTTLDKELVNLVYGTRGIIIVDNTDKNYSIEAIKNVIKSFSIGGYILRESFGRGTELEEYTDEDWYAIFAGYSRVYGWGDVFRLITGQDPDVVYANYFKDTNISDFKSELVSDKKVDVRGVSYLREIVTDIASNKAIPSEQEYRILSLVPTDIVNEVLANTNITIKEIKALLIARAVKELKTEIGTKDSNALAMVVRGLDLNNSDIQLRVVDGNSYSKFQKAIRKRIWRAINNVGDINAFRKYPKFWKGIFKALRYTDMDTLAKVYPNAMAIRYMVYTGKFPRTYMSDFEDAIRRGDLASAITILSDNNPSSIGRYLSMFFRYKRGDQMLNKVTSNGNPITVTSSIYDMDVNDVTKALSKVNRKLLLQFYLLDHNKDAGEKRRLTHGHLVSYNDTIPEVDVVSIREILRPVLLDGSGKKVFIDDTVKNYPVSFTDRENKSLSLTGEILPSGAIINIDDNFDNKLLRLGIAWKNEISCDIDLHSFIDGKEVYYGLPSLYDDVNSLIATSSGDIVECNTDTFSVEFIDIDLSTDIRAVKQMIRVFSGIKSFDDAEVYAFAKIIDVEDRVIPKDRNVSVQLDEMDYAIRLLGEGKDMYTIEYDNVLREMRVVLSTTHDYTLPTSYDKVLRLVYRNNIVSDIEDADVVISSEVDGAIHPGKERAKVDNLIFG